MGTRVEGAERAALATPPRCGSYSAQAAFTPWAQPEEPVMVSSPAGELVVGEDCAGPGRAGVLARVPCAEHEHPGRRASRRSTLEIARPDGQQALTGVSVRLPPGVAALLSSVTPCQEPRPGWNGRVGPKA